MARMTKEEAALLDAIARSESAGAWNVIYGGSKFSDYSKHPAKYVTITSGPNKGKKSSAAGKYQITKTTYDRVAPKLGITDFSPESQQKIALYLAREKYGPNLAKDLADGKAADVAAKLAGVWTSLPGGIEAGTTSSKFLTAYGKALDAPRPPGFIPDVASSVDTVGGIQQQLAQRGFDPGAIDGINGPRTTAAIKAFQTANGLDPDGVVGPLTRAALEGQARPRTQPQPPLGSRQPANILPPGPLIQPQDIRDAFFNPLPAPKPLTAPPSPPRADGGNLGLGNGPGLFGPSWQTLNTLKDLSAGAYDRPAAPMPMPGRPASLNGLPPVPGRTAPAPMPGRPSGLNSSPPPAVPQAPKLLRLPSGQMIAPGVYDNAKSGIPYTVTEGPNGTAVVTSHRSGFVDLGREINAPTILGGIIRSKIPEAVTSATANFAPAVQGAQTAATQAIDAAVPVLDNIKTGAGNLVGGLFGGMFGGRPAGPQYQPGMLGRGLPVPRAPSPLTPSPMLRAVNPPSVPSPPQMSALQRRQAQQADWERRGLNQFGMLS